MIDLDFVPHVWRFNAAARTRHACSVNGHQQVNGSICQQRFSDLERRVSTKAVSDNDEFIGCRQGMRKPRGRSFLIPREYLSIQCSGVLLKFLSQSLKSLTSFAGEGGPNNSI